jgi:hypothetical protein
VSGPVISLLLAHPHAMQCCSTGDVPRWTHPVPVNASFCVAGGVGFVGCVGTTYLLVCSNDRGSLWLHLCRHVVLTREVSGSDGVVRR